MQAFLSSKDVRLPVQLQRALNAEAEATRECRGQGMLLHMRRIFDFEGEQKASSALKADSEIIACSPSALQLRYLQTLNSISAEKKSTIIFPIPMDIIMHTLNKK